MRTQTLATTGIHALALAAALALAPTPRASGAGCCAGAGDLGIDARWQNNREPVPEEAPVVTLTSASTPTTRGLFADLSNIFGKAWVAKTKYSLASNTAHGPAFAHTRSIIAGKTEPDIVLLDNPAAIDPLAAAGFLPADWRARLPQNSVPFGTTLVFLVRKGNPKNVRDWGDLGRDGLGVVIPDPRDSSVGRWAYLSAWALALERANGDEARARAAVRSLYRNASALHGTANGATGAFVRNKLGDVLLILENEARARAAVGEIPSSEFEIVTPPAGLFVETPVAWLDKNVSKHENLRVSASLLLYLFSPEGRAIAARNHFRPVSQTAAAPAALRPADIQTPSGFPALRLLTLDDAFGGYSAAQRRFFDKDAELDREYAQLTTRDTSLPVQLPKRPRPRQE
jgi:sulfate transport system substrate-binding protein